jgi:glycosyltransferase involved in cell wall biosynthesis
MASSQDGGEAGRARADAAAGPGAGDRAPGHAGGVDARAADAAGGRPGLLVLASTYPRWRDDPEPGFVHELARRLAGAFEVTVVTPGAPGALPRETLDGVRVIRYRYAPAHWQTLVHHGGIVTNLKRSPWKLLLVPGFVLGQWLAARRALRRFRPAAIHAHWLVPQGWVARAVARGRVPYLLTSHGADLFALRGALFARLRRWATAGAAAVTVVSEAMRRQVAAESPAAEVRVMAMGVDAERRFVPDAGVAREPDELLFVGRLVEKKGLRHLIEALPAILAARPGARLTVAGFGPEREALERLARERGVEARVHFLGAVAQERLPALYRRATLFVAPFVTAAGGDQEGLGLVAAEAMACGCPVLAGDVPGIRDLVGAETGVIVPAADHAALAAAIVALLADPASRARLAERGRAHVLANYAWEAVAARYGRLLAEIASAVPRR